MSAASVAAKARDPNRVSYEPESILFEEDALPKSNSAVQEAAPRMSEKSEEAETGSNEKAPHASSLPPEILGLYNKTGTHSRSSSLQKDKVEPITN